ncbi:CHAT domain-containing protein [Bradyrhizobium sp. 168]|uniref:CHAT domain-containing protein n=1 Tax=Bradyrhizobium sp. 168 TaxID=2782639 RepID=UPI001FF82391|nr:CHAT domain-containing protein [Bradyrhizobium sp. 168]MCK1578681.1 CHAT domain-containing protein [Bradyrhizobium sp. 168]
MNLNASESYWQALIERRAERASEIATEALRSPSKQKSSTSAKRHKAYWLTKLAYAQSMISEDNKKIASLYREACEILSRTGTERTIKADCTAGLALAAVAALRIGEGVPLARTALSLAEPDDNRTAAKAWLAIGWDALLRKKPEDAFSALKKSSAALLRQVANSDPYLADLINIGFEKTAETYELANRDSEAFLPYISELDLIRQVYRPNDFQLVERLQKVANGLELHAPQQSREALLWIVDIALSHDDSTSARYAIDEAVRDLRGGNFQDDVIATLWRWKQHVENRFGKDSIQAAFALAAIGDELYQSLASAEGERVFDEALGVVTRRFGNESSEYLELQTHVKEKKDFYEGMRRAGGGPAAQPQQDSTAALKSGNVTVETQERKPEPRETVNLESEADQAVKAARTSLTRRGLETLLDSRERILETGKTNPDGGAEARRLTAHLMDVGYSIAVQNDLVGHWTFAHIVHHRAESLSEQKQFDELIKFLDETIALSRMRPGDGKEVFVRILAAYPHAVYLDKYWPTDSSVQSRFLLAMNKAFSELVSISKPTSVSSESVRYFVDALSEFGKIYLSRSEFRNAILAFETATLLTKAHRYSVSTLQIQILAGYLKEAAGGADAPASRAESLAKGYRAEVDALDLEISKQDRLSDAALILSHEPGGQLLALKFIREANGYLFKDLKTRASKVVLSSETELSQEMKLSDHLTFKHIQLLARSPVSSIKEHDVRAQEALGILQWRDFGTAANALRRSATRTIVGSHSGEARELDRAISEWHRTRQELNRLAASGKADAGGLTSDLVRLQTRAMQLHGAISAGSPDYRRLSDRGSLQLKDVRSALKQDEAVLVLTYNDFGEIISLLVTKQASKLYESKISAGLTSIAEQIRNSIVQSEKFDWHAANEMYAGLFAGATAELANIKHLVLIPGTDLAAFPFAALVENIPELPSDAKWLIYKHSIAVAPSLAGFVALRSQPKNAQDTPRFVGFADPVVEPNASACAPVSAWGKRQNSHSILCPVPETLDHVALLARAWPQQSKLFTGEGATFESLVSSTRERVEVLAFATHGVLARELLEVAHVNQPALLLSKEQAHAGSEWLTAEKIEQLTMNVDLVILSACNTAAPKGEGDEPLSGLARAFFEAGARGVLASGWYIDAAKTRALLWELATRLKQRQNSIPEALAQSMISRIKEDPRPRNWAMFSYIGR